MNHWGKELVLDCFDCDGQKIRSKENIEKFAKALVKAIDMVAFGEPQVIHFGSDDKAGYTLVQLIETSNITAHFAEETNSVYLNVFSCKDFDVNVAVEVARVFFGFKTHKGYTLLRGPKNK